VGYERPFGNPLLDRLPGGPDVPSGKLLGLLGPIGSDRLDLANKRFRDTRMVR